MRGSKSRSPFTSYASLFFAFKKKKKNKKPLPNPEIEPSFPALQADSLPSKPPGKSFLNNRFFLFCVTLYYGILFYIFGHTMQLVGS